VGGLLAQPVRDTMKLGDAQGVIQRTVARDNLWHAQTPQMFRVGLLHHALEQALANNLTVTDEAQAMELQGHYGQLVVGEVSNLKITHPADWVLAEFYLKNQACYPV
jgi:2-C-methyl-D-erythritol 4-phosphate cytidylyltransferase